MRKKISLILALAIISSFIVAQPVAAFYGLSSWTWENNEGADLTLETATTIGYDIERTDECRVYKDFGADYFSENFQVDFTWEVTTSVDGSEYGVMLISNTVGTEREHKYSPTFAGVSVWLINPSTPDEVRVALTEVTSGLSVNGSGTYFVLSEGTTNYFRLVRDETVGTYGRLSLLAFSDDERSNQTGEIHLDLSEKQDFRYLHAITAYGAPTGSGYTSTGEIGDILITRESGTGFTVSTGSMIYSSSTTATGYGTVLTIVSDNYTKRQIQIGTATGVYSDNFTEEGSWNGTGAEGVFAANVTGLTAGQTYYYRAGAYDGTWHYGLEAVYTHLQVPVVTTGGYTRTVVGGQTQYNLSGTATCSDNFSLRGFQIGYADGVWEPLLTLQQLATGGGYWVDGDTGEETPFTDNSTSGPYSMSTAVLSANTTYYYRAYAGTLSGWPDYTWYYSYGETKTLLTTSGTTIGYPVVTTDNAYILPNETDAYITMGGTIISFDSAVVQRGFRWSLSANMTNYSYTSRLADAFPVGYYLMTTKLTGVYPDVGQTIYIQAFVVDAEGHTGEGNVISYVVPEWNVGPGGLTITNGTATVLGNSATLTATLSNPGSVTISRYGFAWGETSYCSENSWADTYPAGMTNLSHVITDLEETTVYFFKAGVLLPSGKWYWSTPTPFTTGSTIPLVTGQGPTVQTTAASNSGGNYFTANGNLISLGSTPGSYVSERGFVYSLANSGSLTTWASLTSTGNFSVGTFSKQITVSESDVTVYYAAMAKNQYGTSYGRVWYVSLKTSGSGTSTDENEPGTISGFAGFLQDWMASLGMDNSTGHWAFMFLIMLLVAIGFGVAIALVRDRLLKTVLIVLLAALEVIIVGGFIFSGLLGIWPALILVFVAAGLAIIFGGRLLSVGRV